MKLRIYLLSVFLITFFPNLFATQNAEYEAEPIHQVGCEIVPWYTGSTAQTTYILTFAPSETTSNKEEKLIMQAKQDAYAYVASKGQFHTAYLEGAFILIRTTHPNYSDIELAQAIIGY